MKISKLTKTLRIADDVRLLTKIGSGLPLSTTIEDLSKLLSNKAQWCLCGGLAVGYHSRPRGTDDIDILLENDNILSYVFGLTSSRFKKISDHMISHIKTGVTIDLITPKFINADSIVVNKAIQTAQPTSIGKTSIPVITREGLVALKLNRGNLQDQADIEAIIRSGGRIDISSYPLTDKQILMLKNIESIIFH